MRRDAEGNWQIVKTDEISKKELEAEQAYTSGWLMRSETPHRAGPRLRVSGALGQPGTARRGFDLPYLFGAFDSCRSDIEPERH